MTAQVRYIASFTNPPDAAAVDELASRGVVIGAPMIASISYDSDAASDGDQYIEFFAPLTSFHLSVGQLVYQLDGLDESSQTVYLFHSHPADQNGPAASRESVNFRAEAPGYDAMFLFMTHQVTPETHVFPFGSLPLNPVTSSLPFPICPDASCSTPGDVGALVLDTFSVRISAELLDVHRVPEPAGLESVALLLMTGLAATRSARGERRER